MLGVEPRVGPGVDRGVDPVIERWRRRGKGREFATGSFLHQSFLFETKSFSLTFFVDCEGK